MPKSSNRSRGRTESRAGERDVERVFERSNCGVTCDILPALKGGASRPVSAGPVNPEGWESKVPDRRQWQCQATDTRPRRGVASYLVVLCRSAWSAHCFETGLRRGRHRVNCQFSTHRGFYRRLANQAYGAYPRRKRRGFAPVQPDNKRTPRLSGRGLSDRHSSETTRLGPAGVVCRPKLNGKKLEVVRTNRDTPTPTASGGSCPRRTGMGDHHSCGGGLRVRPRARGWGIPVPSGRGGCQAHPCGSCRQASRYWSKSTRPSVHSIFMLA